MIFEWDEHKNKDNRKKHGIWFEEAQTVFQDDNARYFFDKDHSSKSEDRFVILGLSSAARMLVVVHCYRQSDEIVRIISARKVTQKEALYYEKGI